VVLGGLFMQVLSPSIGPISILLRQFNMRPIFFLGDPTWFRPTVVVTHIWQTIGWGSIVYIASIAGINPELYEASIIDGANRFQNIRYITLPGLAPVITIMFIFAVGRLINDDFDQIFNLYNPAVYKVGDVISTYVYRRGLEGMQFSYATAVGLFRNLLGFILLISTNFIARRLSEYSVW
jgi:putative aldouronate transport system permease protein